MRVRDVFIVAGFVFMTLLASLIWVLLLDLIVPLKSRLMPLLASLPMVALGGYVAFFSASCFELDVKEASEAGLAVSIITLIILFLFFAF